MAEEAAIEVQGLTVEVQTRAGLSRPVDGLDFTIGAHEIVGLVGESGSGKSLTSLALTGLKPASAEIRGSVNFAGTDLLRLPPGELREIRGRDVGYVFQDPQAALNPLMRCGDQISEGLRQHLRMSRAAASQRAVELLDEVGLREPAKAARKYPHELSGGMRQRVMIAMAIACEPRLIIADEPTTALDVVIERQVVKLLEKVWERSRASMIFVSHDIGLVASLCHRIIVMRHGKIVESGPTKQVTSSPQHPYTKGLIASIPGLFAPRLKRFVGIAESDEPSTEALHIETDVGGEPDAPAPSPNDGEGSADEVSRLPLDEVLKVNELRVAYSTGGGLLSRTEEFVAVEGASFTLGRGEILGVVGESGSGKTSLARALIGLVQPTSGAIELEGTQVYPPPDRRAYRAPLTMQMVFQDPYASLNPRMRVEDLVAEAIDVGFDKDRKARREGIVAELLERVGIDPSLKDRFPHQFSGGQRQRIAIARALAAQPRVLICDEAVSSLDVSIRAHVLNVLIQERLENHLSIVFIGHDLTVVRHLADRVIVMHNGAVVEEGTAEDVIFRPVDDYTKKLVQASSLHALDTTRIPQPSTAIGTGGTIK